MNIENIKTFEDWKEVMGTRFRLTKDEKDRGLSRERALAERIASLQDEDVPQPRPNHGGEILIRIQPEKGVDAEFFQQLSKGRIEVTLDEKWYGWLDTKLGSPYDGNLTDLVYDILERGLDTVIGECILPEDI